MHFHRSRPPPAMIISSLFGHFLSRAINGVFTSCIPKVAGEKLAPPSVVRQTFRSWNETAQSVSGLPDEMALSAPSPPNTRVQASVPVHFSVPLSWLPANAKFGLVGWTHP